MNKSFDSSWEDIHKKQEWGKYPSEDVIRFIARNYYKEDRGHVKILDFGCGAGANTWYLAKEGFDVYAFDGSKSAIEKAKRYLEREGLQANFQVSDALNILYEDNYFNCVVDSAAVYANISADIIKMYQKIYNLLLPKGKLFTAGLFTPNTTGYNTGIKIENNTFKDLTEGALAGRGTVHFFEKNEIIQILEDTGFQDINIDVLRRTDKGNIVEYWIVNAEKQKME